jgi:hypothetical protein
MKIQTTAFDSKYHGSQKTGNNHVLHNIDVYNTIIIDNMEFQAVYQCGQSFIGDNYNNPNRELELSEDGGTSKVLLLVDRLYKSDFENNAGIAESLAEVMELCPLINTVEKLEALYDALNDNLPVLSDFLDSEEYTDNPADYVP